MSKYEAVIEDKICVVCGKVEPTNSILMDPQGNPIFNESHLITGYHLCEEHQKLYDEGYIALVVINSEKSTVLEEGDEVGVVDPYDIHRTGTIIHVTRKLAEKLLPEAYDNKHPMIFISGEIADYLNDLRSKCISKEAKI